MSTVTISIQEYTQWVQNVNTTMTTAFSDFVHSMQQVSTDVKAGLLTDATAQSQVANLYEGQYRQYADSADAWAQRAAQAGDANTAEAFERISEKFTSVAEEETGTDYFLINKSVRVLVTKIRTNWEFKL